MSCEVKAIVLSSKDSKDKDKEVLLYSLEKGKVYAKFKGVKNQKAKLKAGKEPFTFGDFFLEEGKAGQVVTSVNIIESFYNIAQDIDKYFEACALIDVVKKYPINQSDPDLFISIIKSLNALNCQETQKNIVFFKFLIDFFQNNGYKFDFNKCSSCGSKLTGKKYLNPDIGEIVCSGCKQLTYIEVDESIISAINILKNTDYEKLSTMKLSELVSQKLVAFLSRNFEWRFDFAINIY